MKRSLVASLAFLLALPLLWADNVRVTNDFTAGGYLSVYTIATGNAYTDAVLTECSIARGRQNEPAVAVNPRNTQVLVGSSNDYCGVYSAPEAGGPIWLGYYRSENGGSSFQSSLVPGYPGDTSPYAALAHIRTASAGDPVVAWDAHGRVYVGAESSGDPAGTNKTYGDIWVARFDNPTGEAGNTVNDGKRYLGTETLARGSSAPNFLGKFFDKTALEADRTGGPCDANVYFGNARFAGIGVSSAIYFFRSTNHGASWSKPLRVSMPFVTVQDPSISVTGNGNVYLTFHIYAFNPQQPDEIAYVKSTDCGVTFSAPMVITTFLPASPIDVLSPQPIPIPASSVDDPLLSSLKATSANQSLATLTRDCGDFADHCQSGYTFPRRDTSPRSTADQYDTTNEYVYIVYEATKPNTVASTGTTYGTIVPGKAGQSGVYFVRLNGATGAHTAPALIDNQSVGHQFFPAISADGGTLHTLWWDSRLDPVYSPIRPIGNDASGNTYASLDVWSAISTDHGSTWTSKTRLTTVSSNPNYEQFDNRSVPFAGDYLWITSLNQFSFGVWTDWRDTVGGTDPRESGDSDADSGADVKQCRTFDTTTGAWSGDTCPHAGGIDQNIYGNPTP